MADPAESTPAPAAASPKAAELEHEPEPRHSIEEVPAAQAHHQHTPSTVEEVSEEQDVTARTDDEDEDVDLSRTRVEDGVLDLGPHDEEEEATDAQTVEHEHEHDADRTHVDPSVPVPAAPIPKEPPLQYGVPREFRVVRPAKPDTRRATKPHSSYYLGPPSAHAAYGTPQASQIGVHWPREIVRVERDYGSGELVQFSPTYPLELEGRISATQFIETINCVNEILISAHSLSWSAFDNVVAIATLYLSTFVLKSHYEKEMLRLASLLDSLNAELYNPVGLNILWPRSSAFLFLEIEYY